MTFTEFTVSDWSSVEVLEETVMARKPAMPPEDEEEKQATAELQAAFGQSIRAARMKAGLTQAELAERSGVRQDDVSRIEAGQVNVTLRTMGRLAKVFDGDVWNMLQAAEKKV